jgi:HDOD domain-containing protein
MPNTPKNKDAWLRRLQRTSLPSFSQSIQKLSSSESFVGAHSSELSRTILKDPSLTAAVLKLANSVQFNSSGNAIRTVSRGVMMLGHKTIKEICSSCLLLENFLKDGASDTLRSILSRSFHAAIQAKEIANLRGDKEVEEIFISALLLNLGEISVYSSMGTNDPLIRNMMIGYPFSGGKEKDLIGCYFNELTLSLCHSWGIAPMIAETLSGNYSEKSVCRSILLANSLAVSCEQNGIDNAISSHLKTISRYCKTPEDEVAERIELATEVAKQNLRSFGLSLDGVNESTVIPVAIDDFEVVIDKANQLDAIQELSSLVQDKFDINLALQMLLEGLSRGAGFDGCLVGLLNPSRNRICAKLSIEKSQHITKQGFDFNCAVQIPEVQHKVLTNRDIVLLQDMREKGKTRAEIIKHLSSPHSIWGPLVVENQVIGCIYADNGLANQPISAEQIAAFELFVYQAKSNLGQLR